MERTFGTDISNANNVRLNRRRNVVVISVEAAIGTGKSSLLKLIAAREPRWVVVQEPVDRWQRVGASTAATADDESASQGHNLLEAFYNNLERYAFSFQTYCVLSRIDTVAKALAQIEAAAPAGAVASAAPADEPTVVVLERSWFSDRHTFAEMLRKQGRISAMEWALYEEWYAFACKNAPTIDGHVYLDCSTDTCMARLRRRGRSEETAVTADYQRSLIDHHEAWLDGVETRKVCRVNVDTDFIHDPANGDRVLKSIRDFIAAL